MNIRSVIRFLLAIGFGALLLCATPLAAAAQPAGGSPPPNGSPPPQQGVPAPTSPASSTQPSQAVADQAVLSLATEADILAANHRFTNSPTSAFTAFANSTHLEPADTGSRYAVFASNAGTGYSLLPAYSMESPPAAQPVISTLQLPESVTQAQFNGSGSFPLTSTDYLDALDDLVNRDGRPPQTGVQNPDGAALAAFVNSLAPSSSPASPSASSSATASATAKPSSAQSGTSSASSRLLLVGLIATLVVILLLGVVVLVTRVNSRTPKSIATQPLVSDLFEVSRHISAATTSEEVLRVAIREARTLTSSSGAAYVAVQDGSFRIEVSAPQDILDASVLGEGMIGRVAETAQPILQVSATEPSIRNLPIALLAVPVVNEGRVQGVLLVLRDADSPFTEKERELMQAVAPVTATALLNAQRTMKLSDASFTDPLTGIGNRRKMDRDLAVLRASADDLPLSSAMVDLDHFKQVNDAYGHHSGDLLLAAIATRIADTIRPQDRVYRYGGEEFCILFPSTTEDQALDVATRICDVIRRSSFDIESDTPHHATASIGVSCATAAGDETLVPRADEALYYAKEHGRDQAYPSSSLPSPAGND